ncbi:triacylglycerol lipase 1-like [Pyrus ussuriensis x Pyrus communis]|uniref:Triacylglycerol lipase 1-like n=1 Tax=Pyrus ussuriensis x Pyrus communis TaxID=2448454 RepID=A0A5N5EUS6_9ROSA|nr:triacylglycerol lipase 1-like [Pyrus ussuriensis x Pyrus communis]
MSDAWFLNSPEESLGFVLADEGFLGLELAGIGSISSMRNGALHIFDLTTSSKVFVVGRSQGTIMSLTALTQPDIAELVEVAALFYPISYLEHHF